MEELTGLLRLHGVALLVDVRTIPRSRHNPQFNRELLPGSLEAAGIQYRHCGALGGLRHARKDSMNTGWRNASFRGYADYMQTEEFSLAVNRLAEWSAQQVTAIMCTEAVPWRCHRSLIADALLIRGFDVFHIISAKSCTAHTLTPWARVQGETIVYPAERSAELRGLHPVNAGGAS